MRQRFSDFAKTLWEYTNTNVGAVFLGSGITYFLTTGANEKRISKLEEDLSEATIGNRTLMQSVTDLQTQYAITNKDLATANSLLQKSTTDHALTKYAYYNSMCFWRHTIPPDDIQPLSTHPKKHA